MPDEDGGIRVPDGPGLGVTIDREKLRECTELDKELCGHAYGRDPADRDWFALVPNETQRRPLARRCAEEPRQ